MLGSDVARVRYGRTAVIGSVTGLVDKWAGLNEPPSDKAKCFFCIRYTVLQLTFPVCMRMQNRWNTQVKDPAIHVRFLWIVEKPK